MVDGDRKLKATYPIAQIKSVFAPGCAMNMTRSARIDAQRLGLGEAAVIEVIQQLEYPRDFEKSMRSNADPTVWQDVYKPTVSIEEKLVDLYVKFTLDGTKQMLLISFKAQA